MITLICSDVVNVLYVMKIVILSMVVDRQLTIQCANFMNLSEKK